MTQPLTTVPARPPRPIFTCRSGRPLSFPELHCDACAALIIAGARQMVALILAHARRVAGAAVARRAGNRPSTARGGGGVVLALDAERC